MNVKRKYFICTVLVLSLLFASIPCWSIYAADLEQTEVSAEEDPEENEMEDVQIPEENSTEISDSIIEQSEVTEDSNILGNHLVFTPREFHSDLNVTTVQDVYNILVSIYNLLLMFLVLGLIVWTYNMITSAFRRFLYR